MGRGKGLPTVVGKFDGSFIASLASRGKIVGGQFCKKATLHILRPATSRIVHGPLTAAVRQGSSRGARGPACREAGGGPRTVLTGAQGTGHPNLRTENLGYTVCRGPQDATFTPSQPQGAIFSPPFPKNMSSPWLPLKPRAPRWNATRQADKTRRQVPDTMADGNQQLLAISTN